MKHVWKYLIPLPCLAALIAMVPQTPQDREDPAVADVSVVARMSELQYVDTHGKTQVVSARNVLEIRLLEDHPNAIRLELVYENGDYSLIDATAFHILRVGRDETDVRLVRSRIARTKFPRLK